MPSRTRPAAQPQLDLWQPQLGQFDDPQNLTSTFRRLYYHLYSNSNASRAERIVEDLSLILLLQLSAEVNGGADALTHFRTNGGSANEVLLPILRRTFPNLVDDHQRFSLGDQALRRSFEELSEVRLSTAPAHVLGDAFQSLIGPRLRGDKGQFFTPRSLVRAMVQVIAPQQHESVLDPACGTGGFLAESHAYQVSQSGSGPPTGRIVGIDKDHDLFRLATALLQISTNGRAEVRNFNSLDLGEWPATVGRDSDSSFDVVLTNPPFGARIGVRDRATLSAYALGHQWAQSRGATGWRRTSAVASSQDPQLLFLELCVRKLKPGGRLGIVLPEGVFGNKRQGYVWDWLRSQGQIFALLDCPRTTFQPGTDTKTNVLFFRKSSEAPRKSEPQRARIAVALHCGHDRRGRTHLGDGRSYPDDFARLGVQFHSDETAESAWREVVVTNLDYLVPRYYSDQRPRTAQEAELTHGARTATLADLVDAKLVTIRKGHEVGSEAYGTGDIPFVRTSDIANFEISADPTNAVSEDVYRAYAKQQKLRPGDVLMVVDGRYRIGATALLTEQNHVCVVQSHFRILGTPRPSELDPYELLFALNLPSVRLRIRDLVFVQSTLGTLGRRIFELRIPILHGAGPWQEKVERFRHALTERSRLLAETKTMTGPEYEL